MSTTISPEKLRNPLRPMWLLGGSSYKPLFETRPEAVAARDNLSVGQPGKDGHVSVLRSREMPRVEFQKALCDTKDDWRETTQADWLARQEGGKL